MSAMPVPYRTCRTARLGAALSTLVLAACASTPTPDAPRSPLLALKPSALGCEVAVQQRLTLKQAGKPLQQLDALLEVDAQAVRVAFFVVGQGMGSMVWDGRQLDKQLSRHWPAQLVPEQILSDLQLAFWPAQHVQRALQAPWQMDVTDSGRSLLRDGSEQVRVQFLGRDAVEITYPAGPFVLRVESPGGHQLCTSAREPAR